MDPIWIVVAFVFGFAARQVKLPPLVGFLVAGFVLNAFGVEGGETLDTVAEVGVWLLLFSIGLKLRLGTLARPEVWAGASLHMTVTVIVLGLVISGIAATGIAVFSELSMANSLLLAFALSFSSTVFAVKVLEDKGERSALHGRVAIGILIMQDLFAVIFMTVSMGKTPSAWALLLLALPLLRPVLRIIMGRCGHGELLVLLGLLLVFGATSLFTAVNLKPDLGALIIGVLVGGHPKSKELASSLLGFQDLFLVGFFLSIGLSGVPELRACGIAVLLIAIVPVKAVFFFLLLTRFRLRARTSLLASLSLANFSEFGLIVGTVGVANGWLGSEWLVTMAIAVSISFVLAAPLNGAAHAIYGRYHERLKRFETAVRLPDDRPLDPGDAEIVVFGMGRIGQGAYDALCERYGDVVAGIDRDPKVLKAQRAAGRRVALGDGLDADFWERVRPGKIRLVLLALPSQVENLGVARQLKRINYDGLLAATANFEDQVEALKAAGVHAAFNFYSEAGAGFAEHVSGVLDVEDSTNTS